MLRPPDEEVLRPLIRAFALVVAITVLAAACSAPRAGSVAATVPPAPSRNTAAVDDPADRARFACAVEVQRAQDFDLGRSLHDGALLGAAIGAAAGAALGAVFGLIGDVPGRGAAAGALAGAGVGAPIGGLAMWHADRAAYERGLAACLAGRVIVPPAVPPGLVEYRLRTLSVRQEAFDAFLGPGELTDGVAGNGLVRLAGVADAGALERGVVLYDRHIAAVAPALAPAFGAAPAAARVKRGGGAGDPWDEARWHGRPGERSVWAITAPNRRPQEVRRIGLSDATAIAQFRPSPPPLFGAAPEAAVAVPLALVHHAQATGHAVTGALDPSRAIAAVVARNDDRGFPDRVYLVVTHAASPATYEAVLAWGERAVERGAGEPRLD